MYLFILLRNLTLGISDKDNTLTWHGPTAIELGKAKEEYEAVIHKLTQQCAYMSEKLLRLEAEVEIQKNITERCANEVKAKTQKNERKHEQQRLKNNHQNDNENKYNSLNFERGIRNQFGMMDNILVN